jgi:hypothetical protein
VGVHEHGRCCIHPQRITRCRDPQAILLNSRGVLLSDFYAAYDSMPCAQQKCLVHLMRDLNEDLSKQPFNEEMKEMAQSFANLLKPMIETVNRFGLRAYHLRRHKASVKIDFMTSFLNGAIRPRLRSATRGASSGTQASFSHSLIMTGFLGTAPTLSTPSRLSCDFAEALTAKAPQKESRIILFS